MMLFAASLLTTMMMVARWSRKLHAGDYEKSSAGEAFFFALGIGWAPPLAIAFLVGERMHRRELARAKREKEIEAVQRDVLRLVGDRK